MRKPAAPILLLACLLAAVSCKPETPATQVATPPPSAADVGVLVRVGSVSVTEADLALLLEEKYNGRTDAESRQSALDELTDRARLTQAAYDAGIADDAIARAEIARILSTRLREKELGLRLAQIASAEIPEARLREIYESQKDQFQSPEKRQIAVLWLDPGANPERVSKYQERLEQARTWLASNTDVLNHPEQGFSTLSVDFSEHAPTRYKNGVLGWLEPSGGIDAWSKAVAEIAFSLEKPGDTSAVTTRPEGIFLVRCMAVTPAFQRPFEAVSGDLAKADRALHQEAAEQDFADQLRQKYPVAQASQADSASR
ncbi:MAG: peptidyl-prolyl cis-trans isomerase [Verrucomicrobiota bacterium]